MTVLTSTGQNRVGRAESSAVEGLKEPERRKRVWPHSCWHFSTLRMARQVGMAAQ